MARLRNSYQTNPDATWGLHEEGDARRAAVNADLQFRALMLRAGHKEGVVTAPSTEHPRFTPHRGVPPRTGSPAGDCADANGDSNTTEYR